MLSRRQALWALLSGTWMGSQLCAYALAWETDESRSGRRVADPPSLEPAVARRRLRQPGCILGTAGLSLGELGVMLVSSTGDVHLDRLYKVEQDVVFALVGVRPDFSYFNDVPANAFATSNSLIGSSTFGSVLYGVNLIRKMRQFLGDTALVGIVAHENAHILQYHTGFPVTGGKIPELHADYLAGWYLGRKRIAGMLKIDGSKFAKALWSLGDFNFNLRSHHGMPAERVSAMVLGFQLAHQYPAIAALQAAQNGAKMLGL